MVKVCNKPFEHAVDGRFIDRLYNERHSVSAAELIDDAGQRTINLKLIFPVLKAKEIIKIFTKFICTFYKQILIRQRQYDLTDGFIRREPELLSVLDLLFIESPVILGAGKLK